MFPTLAAYLHALTPEIIKFNETWSVRWYGLSYLLGFFIAYLLVRRVARVGRSTLRPDEAADLIIALALGVVIGGRVGYVLFYDRSLLTSFSSHFPFWGLLAINRGGMASHGGIVGGAVACLLYARRFKHDPGHIIDLMAFGAPLGLFFGRIANFINGELYGREASPDLPWAVKFPQEMFHWSADQIARLIAVQQRLPVEVGRLVPVPAMPAPGEPISVVLQDQIARASDQNYVVLLNIHEAIKAHQGAVSSIVAPLITPRHPSQLYEAVLEGLVVFLSLALIWMRPRKPYVIGGAFGVVYGVVRIIGEQFRMPDAHLLNQEFASWGVTRGQWLSALLVLLGVGLLALGLSRRAQPMGGWRLAPTQDAGPTNGKP